jgi:hypothetical protein
MALLHSAASQGGNHMRPLLATTAVTLLTICVVSSAPRTAAAATALGKSAWSVELGTVLGQNNEASIAIRHHSSASSALRLGLEFEAGKVSTNKGTTFQTGVPDLGASVWNSFVSNAISIQWMRFAPIRDNVTATFAVGPVLQISRSALRNEDGAGDPSFSGLETSTQTNLYGLDLGLGVEWFFNGRLSLGASTGLRALIGTAKSANISRLGTGLTYTKREINLDSDVTQVNTGTGKIQLTGYF